MRALRLLIILMVFASGVTAQEISPWLFGQNHWMDRGDEGDRPGYLYKLWPEVEKSGINMVRIGGNGYLHRFPDRNTLTAMVDSIRSIGAEPLLQVPPYFSVKDATALVNEYKYSEGKGVRFYSIGNEPLCNDRGSVDEVYAYMMKLAPAMKAADPEIKILVFDECTFYKEPYEALCGGRLDITGRDKNGNWMIDGFTFHNYPNGRDFDRDDVVLNGPNSIRQQVKELVGMMESADAKHHRTGEDRLLWGLTEVNVTYLNPDREISGTGNTSFLGGQFIAEIYGIGLEYGAFTVCPWCISETDRINTDFGYLGLPSEFHPRSSYYHTQMMALHMTGEFLPSFTSNSYVTSIATMSDAEIVVMILNKDQTGDFEFNLFLQNEGESSGPLSIWADAGIDKTISGMIPSQATMMFVISKTGEIKKQITYGISHNLKYLPPEVEQLSPASPENVSEMEIRRKPLHAIEARSPDASDKYVDLGPYYNFSLTEEIHGKPGNTIPLLSGINEYHGVRFDVRGIIQLASNVSYENSHIHYPGQITGIPVRRKAKKLCFLHSSAWASEPGTHVAEIVVHYANGDKRTVTLKYRVDVEDWWFHPENSVIPPTAVLAWEGSNERVKEQGMDLKLYHHTWENPLPEVEITSIDLVSSMNDTGYMLYGITCL